MARRGFVLSLFLMGAALVARAQCPELSVAAPDVVDEGRPILFQVSVNGGFRIAPPAFNWAVSAGTIASGQGTPKITVDTTGVAGQSVTATVEVSGFQRRCATAVSSTTFVRRLELARKFDEFAAVTLNERNSRLDNFAIQLQNEPGSRAHVIAYGGRSSSAGAAAVRLRSIMAYLTDVRGIEIGRIETVDGGFKEKPITELWIVPRDADPPKASPSITRSGPKPSTNARPAAPPPGLAAEYTPAAWKEYSYPERNFRVRMPKEPALTSQRRDDAKSPYTTYIYRNKSFLDLQVQVSEYKPDFNLERLRSEVEMLDFMQGLGLKAVATMEPKVIKQANLKVGTRPARFFHVEMKTGAVVRAIAFVQKNRIYYIAAEVQKGKPHGENWENDFEKLAMAFLNSFRLIS